MNFGARAQLEPQLKAAGMPWPANGNVQDLVGKLPDDFKVQLADKLNTNGSTTSDWRFGPVNGKEISGSGEVNTGGLVSLL